MSARPVAIGDSKKLYQSGKGLGSLERGVLAMLHVLGCRPRAWRMVFDALAPGARDLCPSIPWYDGYDEPVPLDADPADYDRAAGALAAGLAAAGVRPVAIRSRVIFEEEFNGLLERHPTKGAALSHETLRLVAGIIEPLGEGPIHVLCDKHGGRNNYRELLEEAFPGCLIEICGEGREQSVYRFGPAERRVEMRFQARAESHLPAALASMVSKYLRELAMRAFNRFWFRHVPGIAPTAGYPLDARRFKTAIAAAQAELGIPDRLLGATSSQRRAGSAGLANHTPRIADIAYTKSAHSIAKGTNADTRPPTFVVQRQATSMPSPFSGLPRTPNPKNMQITLMPNQNPKYMDAMVVIVSSDHSKARVKYS